MIGLSKKRFGTFLWEDGSDLQYENWMPGAPNTGQDVDACVELDKGILGTKHYIGWIRIILVPTIPMLRLIHHLHFQIWCANDKKDKPLVIAG